MESKHRHCCQSRRRNKRSAKELLGGLSSVQGFSVYVRSRKIGLPIALLALIVDLALCFRRRQIRYEAAMKRLLSRYIPDLSSSKRSHYLKFYISMFQPFDDKSFRNHRSFRKLCPEWRPRPSKLRPADSNTDRDSKEIGFHKLKTTQFFEKFCFFLDNIIIISNPNCYMLLQRLALVLSISS